MASTKSSEYIAHKPSYHNDKASSYVLPNEYATFNRHSQQTNH